MKSDINTQDDNKDEDLRSPLRSILKNQDDKIFDHNIIKQRLIISCLILMVIVIISPIVVCGLILWFY